MMDAGRHPNIELLTCSEVVGMEGFVGNFRVRIRRKPRFVDTALCTGCGLCVEACVLKNRIPSEFDVGMGKRGAAYIPFPQAVPLKAVIDAEHCLYLKRGKCSQKCVKACERGAIQFDQAEETIEVQVGTVILATGTDMYDMAALPQYGYGVYPNVLDSLQFERLCNASGPTGGQVVLADGRVPESIAFLHCIGSRDEHTNRYCSRLCCMHTLKLAHLAVEKTHGKVYEFYIDIRSGGKRYEEFYERVQEDGVIFIRGKASEVLPEDGKLVVKAEDTLLGRLVSVPVDMVVLALGMTPSKGTAEIARIFGVSRSDDGYFMEAHPKLRPVDTNTDGVYVAGCCQAPKDIPDTVAQASAAAAKAMALMTRGQVMEDPVVAEIIPERCVGCGECVLSCPYKAIALMDGKAVVNSALCKGCGTCVGTCLGHAIIGHQFTHDAILMEVRGLLHEAEELVGPA